MGSPQTRIARTSGDVDLMDREVLRDPAAGYGRIRERAPVVRGSFLGRSPLWVVTRYDEVRELMSDPRLVNDPGLVPGADAGQTRDRRRAASGIPPETGRYLDTLLEIDGGEHARLRGLVSRAFTPRRVAELLPRTEAITARLLDGLAEKADGGVVDLMEHFAYPLPITVICELVGVPENDRQNWAKWGKALFSMNTRVIAAAVDEIVANVRELIALRGASPADDLITGLIQTHDEDGDRLTDTEMVTMVLTLVVAGYETTAHLIGNGTVALLTHPEQLARLRADPGRMPSAIHEIMRWCGPVTVLRPRFATEPLELGGVRIEAGERVLGVLVSANRDPRHFGDPDAFDIDRLVPGSGERHLGFSRGAHYCLGAALGRQEAEAAFTLLFDRYPGARLAVAPEELDWQRNPSMRRLNRLPLRLGEQS